MPRPTRKEERTRRLEEQLRDNLRKRKELSRARKLPGSQVSGDSAGAPETSADDASGDD